MSVKVSFIGASLLVIAQTTTALAAPSLSTTSSVIAGDSAVAIGVPSAGSDYSYSGVYNSDSSPRATASAAASSDINYNTRANTYLTGTGSGSASAQWFETITNSTADRRRYSFSFRIDGGSIAVDGNSSIVTGTGTAGFEALINLTPTGGAARTLFNVSRAVGMTTTGGVETFSNSATDNYAAVTDGGTLVDSGVSVGTDLTSQSWSNSYFTLDLGELDSGESFTLAYLLRSSGNALSDAGCSSGYGGFGYGGYGEGGTFRCIGSTTRLGDPGSFVDVADPKVRFASAIVPTDVPEPASLALLGIGLAGMGAARRRRKSA